jgi:hypothetical protein
MAWDPPRLAPRQFQDRGIDQGIVEHDVRRLDRAGRIAGEQTGAAGAGADQIHPARLDRDGVGRQVIDRDLGMVQQPGGQIAPEAAPRGLAGQTPGDLGAPAAGRGDGGTKAGRQQRFQPLAQDGGQRRKPAAGVDRDLQRPTPHQGGQGDVGQGRPVDRMDQGAGGGRGLGDQGGGRIIDLGRDHHQPGAGKIGQGMERPDQAARKFGAGRRIVMDPDPGAGVVEQGELCRRPRPGTEDHHPPAGETDGEGQAVGGVRLVRHGAWPR